MDQGKMAESVAVTASLLGSQPGSLEHSQRTLGVHGSHSDAGICGFAKELSSPCSATRGFPSLSLSRMLLLCLTCLFQAVGTGAGETTKHKNTAQIPQVS